MPARRIICFGNPFHGDDGFGIHVFARLQRDRTLRRVATPLEAGIAGLSALPLFDECDTAVIVDALKTGGRTGQVHRIDPADVAVDEQRLSLHAAGVGDLIAALPAAFGSTAPRNLVIIGAEVSDIRIFTDQLTEPVQAALPIAINLIRQECGLAPNARR
jgi:hydrogenase maturation protease